jgi:N-methylhydantoinase A/oxoprolinase/acetone carboxylase beta subunit
MKNRSPMSAGSAPDRFAEKGDCPLNIAAAQLSLGRVRPVKRRTKNAKAFHDKCEKRLNT